jgi:hypothetical protein
MVLVCTLRHFSDNVANFAPHHSESGYRPHAETDFPRLGVNLALKFWLLSLQDDPAMYPYRVNLALQESRWHQAKDMM